MEEPHLCLSFTLYISPLTLTIYFTISPPIFITAILISFQITSEFPNGCGRVIT